MDLDDPVAVRELARAHAQLLRQAPLCEKCNHATGTRSGCPYCALTKLGDALSQVDSALDEPEEIAIGVSRYDVDLDEVRVVERVRSIVAERNRLRAELDAISNTLGG